MRSQVNDYRNDDTAEEQLDDEIRGLQKSITVQTIIRLENSHKIKVETLVTKPKGA